MNKKYQQPVVFLPGLGFKPTIWQETAEKTCAKYILLDQLSVDVVPLSATIVAWSCSGLSAIDFCEQFPQCCHHLILVASTPKFIASDNWPGIAIRLANKFSNQARNNANFLSEKFLSLVQYPCRGKSLTEKLIPHLTHENFHASMNTILSQDKRKSFQALTQSISAIFGEKDAVLPIAVAKQLQLRGNIATIADAGHVPFMSHPDQFNVILQKLFYDY